MKITKILFFTLAGAVLSCNPSAQSQNSDQITDNREEMASMESETQPNETSNPEQTTQSEGNVHVLMVTNKGEISIELDRENAPVTVDNFLSYVDEGFYDGTIFHRVINGFMVQGGGFEPGMKQKETRTPIKNEANNGVANKVGTVAMARTMEPHSASAQFFINVNDNDFLNHSAPTVQGWGYTVFGQVTEGMDVVEKIKAVSTTMRAGHQDVPADDVIIERAELVE